MDGWENEDEGRETSELIGRGIFIAVLDLLSCILLTLLRSGVDVSVFWMGFEGGMYRSIPGNAKFDVYRVQIWGLCCFRYIIQNITSCMGVVAAKIQHTGDCAGT